MSTSDLVAALRGCEQAHGPEWEAGLSSRKREEASFHDDTHSYEEVIDRNSGKSNKKFYTTTRASQVYLEDWICRQAKGKRFLDYACGAGRECIRAAKAGAELAVGIDISAGSIDVAKRLAKEEGVSDRTFFLRTDCENTGLPSESFDVVLCSGMLHHLDLSYAFPELRRIMAPGAVLLGFEALNYNPAFKLYRRLTPHLRTSWEKEHILSWRELRLASYFFEIREVRYWHLFSLAATPFRNSRLFGPSLVVANALDRIFLSIYPLSLLAWIFTFELVKRERDAIHRRDATTIQA